MKPEPSRIVEHVEWSIREAEALRSHLEPDVLALEGMSSPRVRHVLNNLVSPPGSRYLEVGVWKGSTFIAAIQHNRVERAVAVDNWSQFQGPREDFHRNVAALLGANPAVRVLEADIFALEPAKLGGPFNVYLYDGAHDQLSQERAFTHVDPALERAFVAVVDDWNEKPVRHGTLKAFADLGYEILFQRALPARGNGDTEQWWNGLFVAVVRKTRS
jgi:hypothetical protein